jgi:hypothetical protein
MKRLLVLLAACGGGDAAPDAELGWGEPACSEVSGTPYVTFTRDEGATLAPAPPIGGTNYAMGLVALETPGHLLAGAAGEVLRSTDAGCTWVAIGETNPTLTLVAAGGERAYGYAENQAVLVAIDGDALERRSPAFAILGLGVDAGDADHVRVVDDSGWLRESRDGGETWERVGVPAFDGGLVYRGAFDPEDLDHAIVGLASAGARVTFDGGLQWAPVDGVGDANVFNAVFSRAQPGLVYLQGLRIDEPEPTSRHIWRSTDGGRSASTIVDQSDAVVLINGSPMFPHPTDADVLYFTFGSSYADYGTDLYRWDGDITSTHNAYHRVLAIAFGAPGVMYLGVSHEDVQ